MIFYITSDTNQNKFDFLKENYALNKDIHQSFNQDDFLKYIKKDIRNIEIDYLIIDMKVFEIEGYAELSASFDAFFLLNSDCKIIIFPDEQEDVSDLIAILGQEGLFVIEDIDNPEIEAFKIINYDTYEEPILEEEIENNVPTIENVIIQETVQDNEIKQELQPEAVETKTVKVNAESIYEKANKPVKLSEGNPLNARKPKKSGVKINATIIKNVVEEKKDKKGNNKIMNLKDFLSSMQDPVMEKMNRWNCKNIMIGIIGVERNTGTTTAALRLTYYLQEKGATVSYTEANQHQDLEWIAEEFNYTKDGDSFKKDGITYYANNQFNLEASVNFIIFDLGCIASYVDNTIPKILFEAMNEIVLVAGGRAYEQEVLISTMEKIMPEKVNLVFNLTSNERLALLHEKYKDKAKIVSSITYEADQCKPGIWSEEIFSLFNQYKQNDNEVINK